MTMLLYRIHAITLLRLHAHCSYSTRTAHTRTAHTYPVHTPLHIAGHGTGSGPSGDEGTQAVRDVGL
jgi:hypothetical protein